LDQARQDAGTQRAAFAAKVQAFNAGDEKVKNLRFGLLGSIVAGISFNSK
jgi:hypothetical protein